MHIMFIPSWYSSKNNKVHGSFFKEQALALKELGINISIAYNEIWRINDFEKIKQRSGIFYELEDNLDTYRYKGFNLIPKNKLMFELFNIRMEKLYNKILKDKGKVDIIHAQSCFWGGISAHYISKKYNIPLVITEHSFMSKSKYIKKSYEEQIINSYSNANKLIAVGSGLKLELEKLTSRNDIEIIPNLIDFKKFSLKDNSYNDEQFLFFSLAFLEGDKGFDTLIKSFSKGFKGKNVKLIIGGDGSQKELLESLVKEECISSQVEFVGALSRDEVSNLMKKADCFILPSKYETFGVVYIEALASGTPIIGTFNGGAEDIINENNGYIVKVDDIDELVVAMKNIIENVEKFVPQDIRNDCIEKYSSKVVANKIIDIYKEII